MTGVKNAIFSTMDASPTLIVHEAMNEYVVERDGIGGIVQTVQRVAQLSADYVTFKSPKTNLSWQH